MKISKFIDIYIYKKLNNLSKNNFTNKRAK